MVRRILITPFQKFVQLESFSGILLFIATIIALIWVNSPLREAYDSLWGYKFGISLPEFKLIKPLILWVNDGLMAIFFFLIGLEIKRELLIGELNSVKKATSPLLAAIGGMSIPVAVFFMLNQNPATVDGWGIPMATDIAFSLAILTLLGKRVPLSLKIFLTAFAIVDDIGAVLVIAIFYSSSMDWSLLGYAAFLLAILFFLSYKRLYYKHLYITFAIVVWVLFLKAGIHPTIAGVIMAFTIPIRQKVDFITYSNGLTDITDNIKSSAGEIDKDNNDYLLSKEQIHFIDDLESWTDRVQSPLQRLEHQLHSWIAYFIMPVFALANAGVAFSADMNLDFPLSISIALSLIFGNLIGVTTMTWLGIKLKITEMPEGVNFKQIIGVSFLAGVGFTMSIFIATLAFSDNVIFVDSAKIGILLGSIISGITGYMILRSVSNKPDDLTAEPDK